MSGGVSRCSQAPTPVLAVGDGALGFWAALREVFPDTRESGTGCTRRQRARRAVESAHPGAKAALGAPAAPPPAWPYGTGQDASLVRSTGK
jgi:hypothetical protein